MRIVHLSDIHLSSSNIEDLEIFYLESLITDLMKVNREKSIDCIVITGDILDKGGISLLEMQKFNTYTNAYFIFEDVFIKPIIEKVGLRRENIICISGNHDIIRKEINEVEEAGLISIIKSTKAANDFSNKVQTENDYVYLKRQKSFLEYEEFIHSKDARYIISKFESKFIYEKDYKIGIGLINDSWRCSSNLKKENHFIGTHQLFNCLNHFHKNSCEYILLAIHHPINKINDEEYDEIEHILYSRDFNTILLHGDVHKPKTVEMNNGNKKYLNVTSRVAFNDPNELETNYQPGYYIIDLEGNDVIVTKKKYMKNNYCFEFDMEDGRSEIIFQNYRINYLNNVDDLRLDINSFIPPNLLTEYE
ncbi:MAG: metallophosphoesterase [Chitinophagales bacterium]|nr:metallophosphoesterase [Chitinophagales bacterium]